MIRRDGDLGQVRCQSTNSQTSIILNIEELMKDFEKELSTEAVNALELLKTHSKLNATSLYRNSDDPG